MRFTTHDGDMADESSKEMAERAAGVLGPESDLFEDLDSAGFGDALIRRGSRASPTRRAPARAIAAAGRPTSPGSRWWRPPAGSAARSSRRCRSTPRTAASPTRRGAPTRSSTACGWPTWRPAGSPATSSVRPQVDADVARKAELALDLALDALAPTNFLALNPAALKRAFDTAGASLVKGATTFLDDLANNEGRPRQVDTSGFEVGRNLAATPGQGRVPQRPDGAASSTRRRPSRCTPGRCCAARRGSTSTT